MFNYYYVIKADVDRSRLVPQLRPIKGKQKTYTAIRYISPGEAKKLTLKYLETREKESKFTRYMRNHTDMVNVLTRESLRQQVPKTKTGRQYYSGVDIENIAIVFEFKEPSEAFGCIRIIEKADGSGPKRDYTDKRLEERTRKKHKRVKNIGKNIAEITSKYNSYMDKLDGSKKMQVGTCVALVAQHNIRIGTSGYGVEDHFGCTTLEVRHFENLTNQPDVIDFVRRLKEEILKPLVVIQKAINEEKDSVKIEKLKKSYDRTKEKIEKNYGWIKPKVGESYLFFVGKSGVPWVVKLEDKRIIECLKHQAKFKLANDRLFDIERRDVAGMLNRYKIVPKDFRNWNATKKFVEEALKIHPNNFPTKQKDVIALENEIVDKCSQTLWNQRGVCKREYLDPNILENFRAGLLTKKMAEGFLTKGQKFIIFYE